MNSILILGAGRSSTALISYVLKEASTLGWKVTVGDVSVRLAEEQIKNHTYGKAITFDILQDETATSIIRNHDVVISMLPPFLHPIVAKKCLQHNKHLLTASYASDVMKTFDDEAESRGLLFLNECGLDPGIDHMSAMEVIDKIKNIGGDLYSFKSFAGGLIAPDTDVENPWRYKFTWNPRNIVLAGQGVAKYLQDGQLKYIPYQQIFQRISDIKVPGFSEFEGYANRDSLKYQTTYGLHKIKTIIRGTLRQKGFCAAWDIFVQLGCTDDTYLMENVVQMTHEDFIDAFLDFHPSRTASEKICDQFNLETNSPEMLRLTWLGIFDKEPIGIKEGTPAQILEYILNKRWALNAHDHDLIVLWHQFKYLLEGKEKEIQLSLTLVGSDLAHTAMARAVGLPLGIATKLLLQNKIKSRGVIVPTIAEFYQPILEELSKVHGIKLEETNML